MIFNDGKRLRQSPDRQYFIFNDQFGGIPVTFTAGDVPRAVQSSYNLLRHFNQYMDENLADNSRRVGSTGYPGHKLPLFQVLRWFRSRNSVVMFLGNGSVQINFLLDHVKVILCTDAAGEVFITMISGPRPDSDELISNCLLYTSDAADE